MEISTNEMNTAANKSVVCQPDEVEKLQEIYNKIDATNKLTERYQPLFPIEGNDGTSPLFFPLSTSSAYSCRN